MGQKIQQKAPDTSRNVASAGVQFIQKASQAGQKAHKTFNSFASYAAERTAQIKESVKKHVCTSTERISTALSKVNWDNGKKVAIGAGITAGLGLLTVATGGVGTIAFAAFMGASMGAGSGAISGGVSAGLGGMASTAANGVSKAMQVTGKYVTENAVDAAVDTLSDVAHGGGLSVKQYAVNLGINMAFDSVSDVINVKAKDIPIPEKVKNYDNCGPSCFIARLTERRISKTSKPEIRSMPTIAIPEKKA